MRISDWSSDVCSSDLQIDVQPRHRQRRRERQIVVERPEIGRQHQLRPRTRELGISARKGPALTIVEIGDEDRFIDLHRSEEHTSELQSLMRISYAVFCLKKKKTNK